MSIEKNLSLLRKKKGLTQQQLGEMLNISAQAVSKWENGLAEPDLTTVKKIASIYNITVDDILETDMENVVDVADAETIAMTVSENLNEKITAPIGFCKKCGITVTNENFGTDNPAVTCKKCYEKNLEDERKKRKEEKEKIMIEGGKMRSLRIKSIITGIIIGLCIMFAGLTIVGPAGILLGLFTYSFVSLLFFEDSKTVSILFEMASKSIRWPGLIFTFDFDGFLWLIGMKILFAVLGFIFGVLCTILGFIISFIFSPFEYPFFMYFYNKELKETEAKANRI